MSLIHLIHASMELERPKLTVRMAQYKAVSLVVLPSYGKLSMMVQYQTCHWALTGQWVYIQMCFGDKKYVIINVYTPYECYENEGEYLNNLATIASVVEELETTCVYIIGDFNPDIADDRSLFARHLKSFCDDNLMGLLYLVKSSFQRTVSHT